jgi:hypothetical protein
VCVADRYGFFVSDFFIRIPADYTCGILSCAVQIQELGAFCGEPCLLWLGRAALYFYNAFFDNSGLYFWFFYFKASGN